MRKKAAALLAVLAACTAPPTATTDAPLPTEAPPTTPGSAGPELYLNLMWHQHQPLYPKDEQGVITRPWVRLHAAKDYWDMAALVAEYPELRVTFNLTPSLLLQLEDLANGAKDSYWMATEEPAAELDDEQRRFVVERFFDVNPAIIGRFPRFQELERLRSTTPPEQWSEQELLDLQVLFNLAWTDPDVLATDPLAALVARGRDFEEPDKQLVLGEHLRLVGEVIPIHAGLWDEGQIEVTTTPLAHPILPLVADTGLATVGDPAALLPETPFQEVVDADQQVIRGLDEAERLLGQRPVGMWPGEGAVAQSVMSLFSKNGVEWVATGEDVLARSLDLGSFTRDSNDVVEEADTLYRPWQATLNRNPPVPMFFRDNLLSDLIGFEYSGSGAEAAADDFMRRLRDIADRLDDLGYDDPDPPPIVSVVLDGENAWENYENDGKDLLRALYTRLSEAGWVETITPSSYLERFGDPEPLEEVFPASWFQPNFATWIGEEEEVIAWEYLAETRAALDEAQRAGSSDPAAMDDAYRTMLFAEGSDWFWWYGSDQDSGNDAYFDTAFRELLGQVYDQLAMERPGFVSIPIIPEPIVEPDAVPSGLVGIEVDGTREPAWTEGGSFGNPVRGGLSWAFDRQNLYLWVGLPAVSSFDVYLGAPEGEKTATTFDGDPLGFGATATVLWDGEVAALCAPDTVRHPEACRDLPSAGGASGVEIAIPLEDLGPLQTGDLIRAKIDDLSALIPEAGPIGLQVPDISNVEVFLSVTDPAGDDHGPGTYTYPTDPVFAPGSYDLTGFEAGLEGDELVLTFDLAAPVQNPWGSPRGLSVQTFDVYIDTDPGGGSGSRVLIPGRNAVLPDGFGWEQAVTVEGWEPAVYLAGEDGRLEETRPSFDVTVFEGDGRVVVRLPLTLLGEGDPVGWGYAVAVMSQEGFPSPGVRRIRDVGASAAQFLIGGGGDGVNQTRILDVAWPVDGEQEELLTVDPVAGGSADDLTPDQLGQLPVLTNGSG